MTEILVYALFAGLLITLTILGMVWATRSSPASPTAILVAGASWLVAVFFMTARPGSGLGVRLNLVPVVVDGPGSAFDALLNTFVFVPPGMLLALLGWRLVAVAAAGLGVSLAIEITQHATNWGRTADVNDLITNCLGACLGWGVVWAIRRSRRQAREAG